MPYYTYKNPKTSETKDIYQSMREDHVYSEGGQAWVRVFESPQMSVDTNINPDSKADFMRATQKRMTMGDMWDVSADLSAKRAEKYGSDPVKDTAVEKYKKKCKKNKHPLA